MENNKPNIGSLRKSVYYRQHAELEIRKIMEKNPYISLGELEKKSGYSRQTIASAYLRIRKSHEWQMWLNQFIISKGGEKNGRI